MKESNVKAAFRKVLVGFPGTVTHHEDKHTSGIADTSYCFRCSPDEIRRGWIEFKYLDCLPKRLTTPIRLGIRPEQRLWIRERVRHGDTVFIIARIIDDIYMFEGRHVDILFRPITRETLERLWCGKWRKKFDPQELRELL